MKKPLAFLSLAILLAYSVWILCLGIAEKREFIIVSALVGIMTALSIAWAIAGDNSDTYK